MLLHYFSVPSNMAHPKEKTPMCLVNELARFNKIQPEYKLLREQGPAHCKVNIVHTACAFNSLGMFSAFYTVENGAIWIYKLLRLCKKRCKGHRLW